VSEIMLQQTRVAAVLEHYQTFLRRFPSVERLARARESSVLAVWSGLGYYRRARMLHQAARQIVRAGAGLPSTAEAWRQLPGVGRYTAAAIASIAFGEPVAVVDGNVERIVRRVFAAESAGPRQIWSAAEHLLERERPGDFNQAMMELGATVCLPGKPLCGDCPIARWCSTRGAGPSNGAGKRRKRTVGYVLSVRQGSVRLRQRSASSRLMPAMWELPQTNGTRARSATVLRHSITDTDYRVRVVQGPCRDGEWVTFSRLRRLPLTGLTRKILRRFAII
jgi:A/G-specific adenine glycosylase